MRDGEGHPKGAPLELKAWLEGVEKKLEKHGVDAKTIGELNARLSDIEQKSARRGGDDGASDHKSLGAIVAGSEGLKSFAEEVDRRPATFQMETKTITSASAGAAAGQPYRDTAVSIPKRPLNVRSLLTAIPVSSGSVEVPRQSGRASNAGMVAEGTLKPQSEYTWEMVTQPARKIAHWVLASAEILADAPQLAGVIDTELVYGLDYVEDLQLLKGDGTGQNLTGMIPAATSYATPAGMTDFATPSMIDKIALAMLQAALANYTPDGVVVHPSDWLRMRLAKNGQGDYILGDPGAVVEPRLFGVPVVPTLAMNTGQFLTGQFAVAATIYDRMTSTVLVSTEDGDNFRKNLVTILAEKRLAQVVKLPQALVTGAFANS